MKKKSRWIHWTVAAVVIIAPIPLKLLKLITCPLILTFVPALVALLAAAIYVLAVVIITASVLDY